MAEQTQCTDAREGDGPPAYRGPLRDPGVWLWVAVAAAVQAAYLLLADPSTTVGDQVEYTGIARDFGAWWATPNVQMLRMPGYPALLALLHEAGLEGSTSIQVLQIVLLSGCVLLVAQLGARIGGRRAARVAGALFATYLPLMSFSSVVLSEALTVSCLLGAAVCAFRGADRIDQRWTWWCAASGALMAVAFLSRPGTAAIALPLVVLMVVGRRTWAQRLTVVLVVGLAFVVALGPWVGRNQAINGALLPTGTTGSYPAALGVHLPFDRAVGQFATQERSHRFWSATRPDGFGPREAEAQDWGATLRENLRHHTGEFLVTRAVGQYQLWAWPVTANTQYARGDVPYPLLMTWHLALIVAGIVGFWRYRRTALARVGVAMVILTAVLHTVTFPQPRYALMTIPFLMVGAAALVTRAPDPAPFRPRARTGKSAPDTRG